MILATEIFEGMVSSWMCLLDYVLV